MYPFDLLVPFFKFSNSTPFNSSVTVPSPAPRSILADILTYTSSRFCRCRCTGAAPILVGEKSVAWSQRPCCIVCPRIQMNEGLNWQCSNDLTCVNFHTCQIVRSITGDRCCVFVLVFFFWCRGERVWCILGVVHVSHQWSRRGPCLDQSEQVSGNSPSERLFATFQTQLTFDSGAG